MSMDVTLNEDIPDFSPEGKAILHHHSPQGELEDVEDSAGLPLEESNCWAQAVPLTKKGRMV